MTDKPVDPARDRVSILVDEHSIELGGQAAGAYLDEIGKTDLAFLTEDEWRRFCTTLVFYALHAATERALDQYVTRLERERVIVDEVPF